MISYIFIQIRNDIAEMMELYIIYHIWKIAIHLKIYAQGLEFLYMFGGVYFIHIPQVYPNGTGAIIMSNL